MLAKGAKGPTTNCKQQSLQKEVGLGGMKAKGGGGDFLPDLKILKANRFHLLCV